MFIVSVYNEKSVIYDDSNPNGKLDFQYQEALRNELSYAEPEAEWSAKFKQGQWDGKISIYNKREQSFPTGLTNKVKELFSLINVEYKFIDCRTKPEKNYPLDCDFGGKELRDYQLNSGLLSRKFQRGMLALCTGAGKTMTSCQIFKELAVSPVVFIVPAIELLKQTQKEFEKYLRLDGKPVKVGIAGGGLCDLNMEGVNVVTYQTALNAFSKKYLERGNKVVDDT
jgi:primosomal protein N'